MELHNAKTNGISEVVKVTNGVLDIVELTNGVSDVLAVTNGSSNLEVTNDTLEKLKIRNGVSENLEDYLYNPSILIEIDWTSVDHMKNGVTSTNPGDGFVVRPLRRGDYNRGFMELLAHLTKSIPISEKKFQGMFDEMKNTKGHYYVTVIEDIKNRQIVAAATLAVEFKFIRGCVKRGRLEDVVVDDKYRGKQFGKLMVTTITLLAKVVGCYKIGLDCRVSMRDFYKSVGYTSEEGNDRNMIIRF